MTQRIVVLSDLHLAPAGPLNNFWASAELSDFLQAHTRADTTLVFAGDTFDLLQLPDRAPYLNFSTAPDLLYSFLGRISETPDGARLLKALRTAILEASQLVMIPGNHDPELFHPLCRDALLRALDLRSAEANLSVYTAESPWGATVGQWQVIIGHGHRGDYWNDIKPESLYRAISTGAESIPLPPGSRLVIDVLQKFAHARDPKSGQQRFSFIDLLKPETPAVPLLLLYIDLSLALQHLPTALNISALSLTRAIRKRLQRSPNLSPTRHAPTDPNESEEVAAALLDGMEPAILASPESVMQALTAWLEGQKDVHKPGTLASHGGLWRQIMRAILRYISHQNRFFLRGEASAHDLAIIEETLPANSGPRVVITGHSHAAREISLSGSRTYLNTGTWTDLIRLPAIDDDHAIQHFIDALEIGVVERLRSLTYAEVTSDGGKLLDWRIAGPRVDLPVQAPRTICVQGTGDRMPTMRSLRQVLTQVLRTDPDLDAFCHDFFPEVFKRFSMGMDRVTKATLLLSIADSKEILDRLRYSHGKMLEKYMEELHFR